jgi:hypothetical protein
MNRSKASSIRRILQLASAGLGGVVALVVTMPLSAEQPVPAEIRKQAEDAAKPQTTRPTNQTEAEINPGVIAAGLMTISPPAKIIPKVPETNDEGQPTAAAPPPPPPAAWRYLGAIESGEYRRAIVLVDGKQHMLAERERLNNVEVLEIKADAIRVMKPAPDNEVTIEKAQRERTRLSLVTPGRSAPAAAAGSSVSSQAALEARLEALRKEGGKTSEAEMRAIKLQMNRAGLRSGGRGDAGKAAGKAEEITLQAAGGEEVIESKESGGKSEGGK